MNTGIKSLRFCLNTGDLPRASMSIQQLIMDYGIFHHLVDTPHTDFPSLVVVDRPRHSISLSRRRALRTHKPKPIPSSPSQWQTFKLLLKPPTNNAAPTHQSPQQYPTTPDKILDRAIGAR